jgi:hypothetical protein
VSVLLTNGEIAVLNAARDILKAHMGGFPDDYGQARTLVMAERAESAIFEYLNNASTWGGSTVTHEQLHGYPAPTPDVPEPQSARA